MKKVSIMGPSIFSWGGFFGLLFNSDIFVLYDDQPYTRNDLSNRNKIFVSKDKVGYITIPYRHTGERYIKYSDLFLLPNLKLRDKYLRGLKIIYSKSKGINDIEKLLINLPWGKEINLIDFQISLINYLRKYIKIPQLILSSDIKKSGKSNELVEEILNQLNADVYLSAFNSFNYNSEYAQKESRFLFKYQNFIYKPYEQPSKKFIPNLSFIDIIACLGLAEFENYINDCDNYLNIKEREGLDKYE